MEEVRNFVYKYIESVPHINEFMYIDELKKSSREFVKKNNDIAELVEIGTARNGEPVEALIVRGGDEKSILAIGFPHPNEPVGSMTIEVLTKIFDIDREFIVMSRATWILVKAADLYGARLNEGWFKGGFDIVKYALNYYRPPGYKQVEWSFPVEYKELKFNNPIPETRALMKVIDEWKPTHIYSLHNSGFSGTYYYVTKELSKQVLEMLYEIPSRFNVPIHYGEPEAPYIEKIKDGIFYMPSIEKIYDWYEKYYGKDVAKAISHGGSTFDYSKKQVPGVFELVCEVPYIYDERLSNNYRIGIPRRELLKIRINLEEELLRQIEEYMGKIAPYASEDNPFYEALSYFVETSLKSIIAERNWIEKDESLDENASVAQAFDAYARVLFYSGLLRLGLLHRSIEFEETKSTLPNNLIELKKEIRTKIISIADKFKAYSSFYTIPISDLVKIQLGAILSTIVD
ncbi:hypothetical protein ACSU1N_05965 [Thermogladius sp. 4427co]|uniref:hypothetical protein n=1 Tax=Thermogladius sp. 4427co TaxID=3450718 RepID=UPI003F7AB4AA